MGRLVGRWHGVRSSERWGKVWDALAILGGTTIAGCVVALVLAFTPVDELWNEAVAKPAPVDRTTTRIYQPPLGGIAAAGLEATHESGGCFRGAVNSERTDAHRCFGDISFVHDPCFAMTALPGPEGGTVLCPDDPWGQDVTVLDEVTDLGLLGGEPPTFEELGGDDDIEAIGGPNAAWALELIGGDRCTAITGGTRQPVGGRYQAFECKSGAVVAGAIDASAPVWSVSYFAPDEVASMEVGVAVAWF